jgi:preprotein translocase subunit SecA
MGRLSPYEGALSEAGQAELQAQRGLIAHLKRHGPPPDRSPPPEFLARIAEAMNRRGDKPVPPDRRRKVGRNETCPCGSGKKYKKCCGA